MPDSAPDRASERPTPSELDFYVDRHPPAGDFRQDVVAGFRQTPKTLSPKYFYDARGSELFDAITDTPEYYVTRTELALLDAIAGRIAQRAGPGAVVIEPGAGSSVKIRKLLDALDTPAGYVGLDISGDHVASACRRIARDYPDLSVGAVCADFTRGLDLEDLPMPDGRRLIFFPGSTIGNFERDAARDLLAGFRAALRPGDAVLVGADRVKDESTLVAAYDDAGGVTADFNLNVIDRINRELGADIDRGALQHRAVWNAELNRMEMHLEALRPVDFKIGQDEFHLAEGEWIHTENSHKFTDETFGALASAAGFDRVESWTDPDQLFSLHWLEPDSEA